jgi:hypothetical protein
VVSVPAGTEIPVQLKLTGEAVDPLDATGPSVRLAKKVQIAQMVNWSGGKSSRVLPLGISVDALWIQAIVRAHQVHGVSPKPDQQTPQGPSGNQHKGYGPYGYGSGYAYPYAVEAGVIGGPYGPSDGFGGPAGPIGDPRHEAQTEFDNYR